MKVYLVYEYDFLTGHQNLLKVFDNKEKAQKERENLLLEQRKLGERWYFYEIFEKEVE